MQRRFTAFVLALSVLFPIGCGDSVDVAVGTTSDNAFTIILRVSNRFIDVGDQTPINVRIRRTDNSNIPPGTSGEILFTTTVEGIVDPDIITVDVTEEDVIEIVANVVFTASSGGRAEVTASFLDAVATVEIYITTMMEYMERE